MGAREGACASRKLFAPRNMSMHYILKGGQRLQARQRLIVMRAFSIIDHRERCCLSSDSVLIVYP